MIVNYRLGALGFLTTNDDVMPPNVAAFDQNLALQWIQENIHHFGGDKNRVTLFGQSSGAVMTKFHSISPMSGFGDERLFHNLIVESGQQMAFNDDPLTATRKFASNVGCLREYNQDHVAFLKCVQGAPLEDVLAASDKAAG